MAAAFEFLEKLGAPFYCFHDRDVAPDGADIRLRNEGLTKLVADLGAPGAQGLAHADLARPLDHRHQHDVHDHEIGRAHV